MKTPDIVIPQHTLDHTEIVKKLNIDAFVVGDDWFGKYDYLKDLGVDYLWLTPFFVSPQRDNGYDVADYRNIDPMFGTMEDLDNLIAE